VEDVPILLFVSWPKIIPWELERYYFVAKSILLYECTDVNIPKFEVRMCIRLFLLEKHLYNG
jgi:hypothetical protein